MKSSQNWTNAGSVWQAAYLTIDDKYYNDEVGADFEWDNYLLPNWSKAKAPQAN